jgi:hypothetical protein
VARLAKELLGDNRQMLRKKFCTQDPAFSAQRFPDAL